MSIQISDPKPYSVGKYITLDFVSLDYPILGRSQKMPMSMKICASERNALLGNDPLVFVTTCDGFDGPIFSG